MLHPKGTRSVAGSLTSFRARFLFSMLVKLEPAMRLRGISLFKVPWCLSVRLSCRGQHLFLHTSRTTLCLEPFSLPPPPLIQTRGEEVRCQGGGGGALSLSKRRVASTDQEIFDHKNDPARATAPPSASPHSCTLHLEQVIASGTKQSRDFDAVLPSLYFLDCHVPPGLAVTKEGEGW